MFYFKKLNILDSGVDITPYLNGRMDDNGQDMVLNNVHGYYRRQFYDYFSWWWWCYKIITKLSSEHEYVINIKYLANENGIFCMTVKT